MDVVAPILAVVVGVLGGYIVGNRQLKYERLYQRRAEIIAELSRLLAAVQHGVVNFTSPFQRGDINRDEQAKEAQRAFFELVECYRANEVWLNPETCEQVEEVMNNVHQSLGDYVDDLDERGYPQSKEGRELGTCRFRETQLLRRKLLEEFRAILYPPPWWQFWR
jgi:hypothetical protein